MPVSAHDLNRNGIITFFLLAICFKKNHQQCNYSTQYVQGVQPDYYAEERSGRIAAGTKNLYAMAYDHYFGANGAASKL